MREYQGAAANLTLTPLEREFFVALENRDIQCQSLHLWRKGVYLMALTPFLPNPKQTGPTHGGIYQSLN